MGGPGQGNEMTRIVVAGASGRMGRSLIEAIHTLKDIELIAAVGRAGSEAIGQDAGKLAGIANIGVPVVESLDQVIDYVDVLVDFTSPEASITYAGICRAHRKRLVIGTTGFDALQRAQLQEVARETALVLTPNMSIGVNLCFKLVELAAQVLGDEADIEIIEAHHRHKMDAPSGTALRLGEIVARTLGRNLDECAVYGRQGRMGPRDPKTIGFETIRAGDIVGEHTVMFVGLGERVEIVHKASSRVTFVRGALRAAQWIMRKEQGLYDMQDVLGLE